MSQESPLGTGSNGAGTNALFHRRAPVGSGRPLRAGVGVAGSAALPRLRWRGSVQPGGAWSEARGMRARLRGHVFISG